MNIPAILTALASILTFFKKRTLTAYEIGLRALEKQVARARKDARSKDSPAGRGVTSEEQERIDDKEQKLTDYITKTKN